MTVVLPFTPKQPQDNVDGLTQQDVEAIKQHHARDLELGRLLYLDWVEEHDGDVVHVVHSDVDQGMSFGKESGCYHAINSRGIVLAESSDLSTVLQSVPRY